MRTTLNVLFVVLDFVCLTQAHQSLINTEMDLFSVAHPSGCRGVNCTFYLGVALNKDNPDYLDFSMEGSALGYIAVGLSPTGYMGNSDVLMCGIDSATGNVGIVDAYNAAGYTSVRDITQNLCYHSADVRDGRIHCSFSRLRNTEDSVEDKSLDGDYYLLLAAVDTPPVGSGDTLAPSYHNVLPVLSSQPVNIVQFFSTSATSGESVTTSGLFSRGSSNTCDEASCDPSNV